MTELKSKHYKEISVKAYSKLINKSDKTVYKMIKEGLVAAKKEDKGYVIRVDNFMLNRCEDMNKNLYSMKELMESFEVRLAKIEKKEQKSPAKKKVLKKSIKPLKKAVKKPLKKVAKKAVVKPLKKSGKVSGNKK